VYSLSPSLWPRRLSFRCVGEYIRQLEIRRLTILTFSHVFFSFFFKVFYNSGFTRSLCGGAWESLTTYAAFAQLGTSTARLGCCSPGTFMASSTATVCANCPVGKYGSAVADDITSCTTLAISVTIPDQQDGPPPMPAHPQDVYSATMMPDAISLRAWPPSQIYTNPTVNIFRIAYAQVVGLPQFSYPLDFEVSIQSSSPGDSNLFRFEMGWLQFVGSMDSANSEGYVSNYWTVELVVKLRDGSYNVPDRSITVMVVAPQNELGCIDATAFNHNPNANTDDSTCKFCFQVLNADVYTCDAIGASGIQSVTCSSGYLETGLAGDNLGCTECPDTGVQCCQNAALHATSTTCSGGGYNDHITSVTCDTGYSESGSVAGGDLGCTLSCEAREQEWLADCACTVDSVDCVAKKNAWTNAGCEPQTCG